MVRPLEIEDLDTKHLKELKDFKGDKRRKSDSYEKLILERQLYRREMRYRRFPEERFVAELKVKFLTKLIEERGER